MDKRRKQLHKLGVNSCLEVPIFWNPCPLVKELCQIPLTQEGENYFILIPQTDHQPTIPLLNYSQGTRNSTDTVYVAQAFQSKKLGEKKMVEIVRRGNQKICTACKFQLYFNLPESILPLHAVQFPKLNVDHSFSVKICDIGLQTIHILENRLLFIALPLEMDLSFLGIFDTWWCCHFQE